MLPFKTTNPNYNFITHPGFFLLHIFIYKLESAQLC